MTLTCRAYAKANLYLDVLERRPDGYHDIETVFQSVSLYDELRFEARPNGGIRVESSDPSVPTGPDNLVYRAIDSLRSKYGVHSGARVRLEKHIPTAAGLAGGSADAAAALLAARRLWNIDLPDADLAEIGAQLGADVPFCLNGGTAAGTERGDTLTPLSPLPETWFVLIHPEIHVSTAEVYGDPKLSRNDSNRMNGMTAKFRGVVDGFPSSLRENLYNSMEPVVFATHPDLGSIKQRLLDAGCVAAAMSGSGPTIMGIARDAEHGETVRERLREYQSTLVKSVPHGVEFV